MSFADAFDDSEQPGDILGEDYAEIRRRVLGDRLVDDQDSDVETTDAENRKIHDALREKHQVDLNDEDNVIGDLEDPNLVARMDRRRDELHDSEEALQTPPDLSKIEEAFVEARRLNSRMVQELTDKIMNARCGSEEIFQRKHEIEALRRGTKPHAYESKMTDLDANGPILDTLGKRTEKAAKMYERTLKGLEAISADLTLLRRAYEGVGSDLIKTVKTLKGIPLDD